MPVRYIPSGDEFKACQHWGEGRHQLSILKNLMSFQKLQQLQMPPVRLNDGTMIQVSSCFGHDVVNIFAPPPIFIEEEIPVEIEEEFPFYIDITVNKKIPDYVKTIKIADSNGIDHIVSSTIEKPWKVGPFENVVWPAKIYLFCEGWSEACYLRDHEGKRRWHEEGLLQNLFSYYKELPTNPPEFIAVSSKNNGSKTIEVGGISLISGDMQGFRWDRDNFYWAPFTVDPEKVDTKNFFRIKNPSCVHETWCSQGEATSNLIVAGYDGVVIELSPFTTPVSQKLGTPEFEYFAKEKDGNFCKKSAFPYWDLYWGTWPSSHFPYGWEKEECAVDWTHYERENGTVEYHKTLARVPFALSTDKQGEDGVFKSQPTESIDFTANSVGELLMQSGDTTRTFEGNPECIYFTGQVEAGRCSFATFPAGCEIIDVFAVMYSRICTFPNIAIMTDEDGFNPQFDEVTVVGKTFPASSDWNAAQDDFIRKWRMLIAPEGVLYEI